MMRSNANLASSSQGYPRIIVDYSLSPENDTTFPTAQPLDCMLLPAEEEIAQVSGNQNAISKINFLNNIIFCFYIF